MDELIVDFLEDSCMPEYVAEVYRSFKICSDYAYPQLYESFIDILISASFTTVDQRKNEFHNELHGKLDFILKNHRITLIPAASLYQKNEMLTALYVIQSLEDYSPVLAVLESLETDEEKLTAVLEDYCQLDQTEQLSILQELDPITLELLKTYIGQQQKLVEESSYKELVPTLKAFFKVAGPQNLGRALLDNAVKPGQSLAVYLEFIDTVIGATHEQTAENIVSLIYLTPESIQSPLVVFNQNSLLLLKDLSLVVKVEPYVIQWIDRTNELLKAQRQVKT